MAADRLFAVAGAVSALLAVAAGAFGAHGLRERLTPDLLAGYETAVRYHLFHALALFGVAWAAGRWGAVLTTWAGWLFLAGTAVFSGSLYLLALTGARWLGAITPAGGVCFLAGWVCLAWGIAAAR